MSNRLRLLAVALLALLFVPASAMQQSDLPPRFNVPWGNNSVAPYIRNIPQASQIGIQNCAASLTDGFPPLTFVPASAGGCPPFGADFNGVLKQITQWSRWQAAGGPVFYDATLSTAVGGYPKGATVQSKVLVGRIWFSIADNNSTDPDSTSSTNWTVLPGTAYPSQLIQVVGTAQPPNTVSANGLTIGNAASNATGRANADTYWLFVRIWTDCPTSCQLFNSSGGAIARGASANADYASNTAVTTYQMNGAGTTAADTQGGVTTSNLNGVPVVTGNKNGPGSILGENTHVQTLAEMAAHNHGGVTGGMNANNPHSHGVTGGTIGGTAPFNRPQTTVGDANIPINATTITIASANIDHGHSISTAGSSSPANIVARTFLTSNWLSL